MQCKIVMCVLAMILLCLFGSATNAQTTTLSLPENAESLEKSTTDLPLRKDGVIPQGTLIRVFIAIVIGLGIAISGAYLLKRYHFARNTLDSSDHHMRLLEVVRLSPRLILFRVRVGDKTIVLAQNGDQLIELDPTKAFKTQQEIIDDEV